MLTRSDEENAIDMVKMGYNEETRNLHFRVAFSPYNASHALEAIRAIGGYNAFDGDLVADAIEPFIKGLGLSLGADIHPYLLWNEIGERYDGSYYCSPYSWNLYGSRNYLLFGLLTNGKVRGGEETEGFAPDPRGMPDGLSYEVFGKYAYYISEKKISEYATDRETANKWATSYGSRWVRMNRETHNLEYHDGKSEIDESWRIEGPDWHSHSWLDLDELNKVLIAYKSFEGADIRPLYEMRAVIGAMQALDVGACNPKFVFWFDN